jgi:hypothetical protein
VITTLPSVIKNIASVIKNALSVVTNVPSVVTNVPSVVTNVPSVIKKVSSVHGNVVPVNKKVSSGASEMIHRDGNVGFPGGSGVSPLPPGEGQGWGSASSVLWESHLHPLPFLLKLTRRKGAEQPSLGPSDSPPLGACERRRGRWWRFRGTFGLTSIPYPSS